MRNNLGPCLYFPGKKYLRKLNICQNPNSGTGALNWDLEGKKTPPRHRMPGHIAADVAVVEHRAVELRLEAPQEVLQGPQSGDAFGGITCRHIVNESFKRSAQQILKKK